MPITAPANVRVTGLDSAALSDLTERLKRALSIDFPDADERLQECIGTAKGQIERYTGCLLSPATVNVSWSTFYDYEDLPKGPVRGTVTATTLSGNAVTLSAAQLGDDMFPRLSADFASGIALAYQAGYDPMDAPQGPLNLPDELQEAVVQYAANLYDAGTRDWRGLASQFKRWGWGS